MSHHNDICKKCYENINSCDCERDFSKRYNPNGYRQLRRVNNTSTDSPEHLLREIKRKGKIDKDKEGKGG